ncbi:MAG: hypothetical protein NTU98_03480 [Bacteroidetes bacterium]|nr:hypothetical protein [Bacteroidota bacterium]
MSTTRIPTFVYYLLLCLIILFSFYNFAEINYPLLTSDMAVNALMAQGVNIPGDLYFWGQDHGGSLLPLLANILVEAYKFPPVMAVSVIHYLILIAGFFALATLFRSRNTKLLLALVWFFPAWHFIDHVLLIYGIQMSMIALAAYLLKIMQSSANWKLKLLWLGLASLTMILAVWVSDLVLVSLVLLALIVIWKYWPLINKELFRSFLKERIRRYQALLVIVLFIIGTAFILYAKHNTTRVELYHTHHFTSLKEILTSFHLIFDSFFRVFTFCSGNIFESIYAWSVLAGIPILIVLSNTRNSFIRFCSNNRWLVFFALNGLATFFFLIHSHWVYINGTDRSYFSVVYISLWITFLLYIESTGSKNRQLRRVILTAIVLLGSFSAFSKFFVPERKLSRLSELTGFSRLGNAGLIADYNHAYLIASADPKHIKATPHDKDNVRNFGMAEEVYNMPKLFLVKDSWLDSFPDTTMQFGHLIVRRGMPFQCCSLTLCRYERIYYTRAFSCQEMQHQGTISADPLARSGKSAKITNDFDHNKHFVYGPFVSLKQGTILVQFNLRSEPDFNTRILAVLEISVNYGKEVLVKQVIRSCDFQQRDYFQLFSLKTRLEKDYDGVEFRILYQGGPDLYFDRIELTGM